MMRHESSNRRVKVERDRDCNHGNHDAERPTKNGAFLHK
jgi:hypothetical protein